MCLRYFTLALSRRDLIHDGGVAPQVIHTKFVIILSKKNKRIFLLFFKDENDPKFYTEGQRKMEPFHATFGPVLELRKCGVVQNHCVNCKIICIEVRLAVLTGTLDRNKNVFSYLRCFDTVRRRVCRC